MSERPPLRQLFSRVVPAMALRVGLLAMALGIGCASILGGEDRTLDPAYVDPMCEEYCSTLQDACVDRYRQYVSQEACIAVCAHLPLLGDDAAGNSVQCRLKQAQLAKSTQEFETHCPNAGPSGDNQCGTPCESYCALELSVCTTQYTNATDCAFKCERISKKAPALHYDASMQYGDTLECRIFHLSAATLNPSGHCPHTGEESTKYCTSGAAPLKDAGATCMSDPAASACDVCLDANCCDLHNGCYNDTICATADDELDQCLDHASESSSSGGRAACFSKFVTSGLSARGLYECELGHCKTPCAL